MAQYIYGEGNRYPSTITRRLVNNGAVLRSQLSYGTQQIRRAGEHWQLDCVWDNLTDDDLYSVMAFFAQVRSDDEIRFHGFDRPTTGNRGAWSGTPVVDGGAQTGSKLLFRGATPSVTGWARAGDSFTYLQAGFLHYTMVTADADSAADGSITLDISPWIRQSPADGRVIDSVGSVAGSYMLVSAAEYTFNASMGRGGAGRVSSYAVTMEEIT